LAANNTLNYSLCVTKPLYPVVSFRDYSTFVEAPACRYYYQ